LAPRTEPTTCASWPPISPDERAAPYSRPKRGWRLPCVPIDALVRAARAHRCIQVGDSHAFDTGFHQLDILAGSSLSNSARAHCLPLPSREPRRRQRRARHSAVASAPAWSPGWREASAASGTERLRAPGRHPPRSYTTCTVNVNSLGTCEATGEPLGVFPGSGLEQPWTVAGGQAKVLITTTCARPGARAVNVKSPRGCSAGAENSPRGIPVRTQCRSDDEPRFSLK
jgi:hypothetical protein